jgi:hypothetical protein
LLNRYSVCFLEDILTQLTSISKLIIIDIDKYHYIPILYSAYKKVRKTEQYNEDCSTGWYVFKGIVGMCLFLQSEIDEI